ncbi:FkbM family methyltransferase [Nocardia takedensis]
MSQSTPTRTRVPLFTLDYLKRDGDPPMSLLDRVRREITECGVELWDARRAAPVADLPKLGVWIVGYHAGMFFHPMASREISTVRVRAGEPVTARFRRNQSDLYILRENFVQRIYGFDYRSYVGEPRVIVDLGANIGLSALYFQSVFPSARIVCAEPVADNVAMLRENARVNGFSWEVAEAAIAGADGTVTLYPNEWWSSSTTTGHVAQARESNSGRLESVLRLPSTEVEAVEVGTLLDRYGIETVDILKMDIEGAEAEVLAGDTAWLDRVRLLIIEIHTKYVDEDAVVDHLTAAGFTRVPGRTGPTDVFVRGDRP